MKTMMKTMMTNFHKRVQQSEFEAWLREHIYCEGNSHAPRSQVILTFIRDLRSFISSKGYSFRIDDVSMAKQWARYLFLQQKGLLNKGHVLNKNQESRLEDYTLFCDYFDSENREAFEEMLHQIQDFDPSTSTGCKALAVVFPFAWYYVDINNSSATEIVDEMVDPIDSDEDMERPRRRGPSDPYLIDQANASLKYNRWD
jgi:hypothetical protein